VRYDGATVRGATVQCGGPWPEGGVRRTFAPSQCTVALSDPRSVAPRERFFGALLKA